MLPSIVSRAGRKITPSVSICELSQESTPVSSNGNHTRCDRALADVRVTARIAAAHREVARDRSAKLDTN
jgi:hypothetical protein